MKVSLSWLQDYVDLKMASADLVDALTMVGLEVDAIWDRYEYLDSVLVGRILEIMPHPNADKLRICRVDLSQREMSVVCGAPNIRVGMHVAVALVGTQFPGGSQLQSTVIRGVVSEGMICSESELALGPDRSGVMDLEDRGCPGEKLAQVLGLSDSVMEIGLTPNRSDCLSIIGLAREVAAIQKAGLRRPQICLPAEVKNIESLAKVAIESPELCPRYAARLLEGVVVGPSPFWLQDRLQSVGLRSINNLVDVTNFVMMETGQPLHAFDFDKLAQHRIVVRNAREGEEFVTLDDKRRSLGRDMLLICDGENPVAIAGVMGGLNSEVVDSTRSVLIESACFEPISIRKTAKKLGMSTEASYRFERGVDPKGTLFALNRAAQLMAEVAGGVLVQGVIDVHPGHAEDVPLSLSVEKTNHLLGTNLDAGRIADLLSSIEFTVQRQEREDLLTVQVPSFRVDVTRPVDLMEEVARLSGYDHIPTTFPESPVSDKPIDRCLQIRSRIRTLMNAFGFTEAVNYSFINGKACDHLRYPSEDRRRRCVHILNPLSEDQCVMRTSLLPGLLENMRNNTAQQVKCLKLFEVGRIYIARDEDALPEEREMLAGLWSGLRSEATWYSKPVECDFYDLKGVAESLFEALRIEGIECVRMPDADCIELRPGSAARMLDGDAPIGIIGEIHPESARWLGLKQTAYIFEIDLARIYDRVPESKKIRPVPKFPAISRDITIIVDQNIEAQRIIRQACVQKSELVEDLCLLDVFQGDPIAPGKKSASLRVTYRSNVKTLEDEDIRSLHESITQGIMDAFGATLPG